MSNGSKRYRKGRGKSIMGSAISDVKVLKAQSRPFSYYTGRWSKQTTPEAIVKWVSKFAKIIDYEELSTHLPNRQFRSYKIITESYSDAAMWNPTNWPGGIIVERFFERKRTKGTNSSNSLNEKSNINSNQSEIENKNPSLETNGEVTNESNSEEHTGDRKPKPKLRLKNFDSTNPESPNRSIVIDDEDEEEDNQDEDIADTSDSQLTNNIQQSSNPQ